MTCVRSTHFGLAAALLLFSGNATAQSDPSAPATAEPASAGTPPTPPPPSVSAEESEALKAKVKELETRLAELETSKTAKAPGTESKKSPAPKPEKKDLLVAGSFWSGVRHAKRDAQGLPWELEILTRKGQQITGEVWMGRKSKSKSAMYAFKGTVSESDKVWIETVRSRDRRDPFELVLTGTIANGSMSFKYSGTTTHGNPTSGTATLAPAQKED